MNVLRALSEASPDGAPERVEMALKEAFRRHHRARSARRGVIAAIATAAASAACIAAFVHAPASIGRPGTMAFHPAPPPMALLKSKRSQHLEQVHKRAYRRRE